MTMSWPSDGVYEWKLPIWCRSSLCELVFGLKLKPCPCFQEASQGWESFPHLNTVELQQACISMNQQRWRVDAVSVCFCLAPHVCSSCMCMCVRECVAQQGSAVQGFSVLPLTEMWYVTPAAEAEGDLAPSGLLLPLIRETEKENTWHSAATIRKPTLWRKLGS